MGYRRKSNSPHTALLKAIKDLIRRCGGFVYPNAQGLGSYRGLADLTAFYGSRVWYIEAKTGKAVLSSAQEKFKSQCERFNVPFIVARQPEDVAEAMGLPVLFKGSPGQQAGRVMDGVR